MLDGETRISSITVLGQSVILKTLDGKEVMAALVTALDVQDLPEKWWETYDEKAQNLVVKNMINRVIDYLVGKRYFKISRKQLLEFRPQVYKSISSLTSLPKGSAKMIKRKLKRDPILMLKNIVMNHLFPVYKLDKIFLFSSILYHAGLKDDMKNGVNPISVAAAIVASRQEKERKHKDKEKKLIL